MLATSTSLPVEHSIAKALPVTFTGSLKMTVILPFVATPAALLIGVVLNTVGAVSAVVKLKT
jgi:hypothetical protein